jgi:protocatechuate 3,4-dioxygenase beta subunit
MRLSFKILFGFISSILFLTLFFTNSASATAYTLSGRISDSSGANIAGATIDVLEAGTNSNVGSTVSNSEGNYTIVVSGGTYNIKVTPPAGSNFSSAVALSRDISTNTILNFILVPAGTVTLNGNVYDSLGNPLANQIVSLQTVGGTQATATTTATGSYSLEASSGTYTLTISGDNNDFSLNVPQRYELIKDNYSLTESTLLDITVPAKRVDLHVQDASGNPVTNVQLKAGESNYQFNYINDNGLPIGGNVNASGRSHYGYTAGGPTTDASGNVTLWLLPTNSSHTYTFIATPPSGSNFTTTSLNNVPLTSDSNLTITMQQPVTLSGHIYDSLGSPLPNQTVYLQTSAGSQTTSTSDASGNYSLQVAPGDYTIGVSAQTNNSLLVAPQYYKITASYSMSQNRILDITIPAKKVEIHVQDASGNPISDVGVKAGESNYQFNNINDGGLTIAANIVNASGTSNYGYTAPAPKTDASGNVTLWLLPTNSSHTYTFIATPPSGSTYQITTSSNIPIIEDSNQVITMMQPVTLNGNVYDSLGNPLANQIVSLQTVGGTQATATTTATGSYSLEASSGTYTLTISGDNNDFSLNVPQRYELIKDNYSLTESTLLDITVPAKRVDLHVQDASGNPVTNVQLKAGESNYQFNYINDNGLPIGGNVNASGRSHYGYTAGGPTTDASGNVTLWLLPTNSSHTYTFIATPPSGSIYQTFTLNNITVTSDKTEIVSLQYNHDTPVTTASVETLTARGTYSNPATVILSATAASGYTVANTYYKIDGGAQQTYTSPFTVSGEGDHTVEYWSVDNSGVPEAKKSKTFTIYVNKPPHVDPLDDAFINKGGTFSTTGSFTDLDSTSWSATVDYGEGAGPETLTLNGNNYSLSNQYEVAGIYTVTVVVRDDEQATGTTMATVTVNAPPQIVSLSDSEINYQDDFIKSGSFTDSDSTSWSATVDFGDGSGEQNLVLNGKDFTMDHLYPAVGTYTVTIKVTDNQGAIDTETFTVKVNAPPHINPLSGSVINEGGTYSENGSYADVDSASWTGTVNYGDGSGVQTLSLNSDKTFSLSNLYKDNGSYQVTITITDNQGAIGTKTVTITVNNASPSVGSITATPSPAHLNELVTANAAFSDLGVLDTHTATWNWGDGTTTAGSVTETNGSGSVSGSHTYTSFGTKTIILTITDNDNGSGNNTVSHTVVKQITVLDPARVWISKETLGIGLRADLLAEVYKDNTLVSSGQLNSVDLGNLGGSFANASLQTIPFNSFSPVDFPSGSSLKVKVSARNACSGSLRNSGTFTLWLNDSAANSRFGATVGTTGSNYYLLTGFNLGTSAGSGPQQSINVAAGVQCSPFKPFGTWTITPGAY